MEEIYYTHSLWRVRAGLEEEFVAAWKAMGLQFLRVSEGSTHGTLIQSTDEPTLFYSFGPWSHLDAINAMRSDPQAQEAMSRLRGLCEESSPGIYKQVAQMSG